MHQPLVSEAPASLHNNKLPVLIWNAFYLVLFFLRLATKKFQENTFLVIWATGFERILCIFLIAPHVNYTKSKGNINNFFLENQYFT